MGSAGWTVCHGFKNTSCCDEWVCVYRYLSAGWQTSLFFCVHLICQCFVVPSQNTFDSRQIKKSVRVYLSSKQSAVDTLHWDLLNHFLDKTDKICWFKAVQWVLWQLPNHPSWTKLKIMNQIMAFCVTDHMFFTKRREQRVCELSLRHVLFIFLSIPVTYFRYVHWGV